MIGGWDIFPADVETAAGNVERAGRDAADAWTARREMITGLRAAAGVRGNDRLANAFYSGYSRRELPALLAATSIPNRFADRAAAGRDSARLAAEAEDAATKGMPN